MTRIDARSKNLRELLSGVKYTIDYYQREYKWKSDNITELLDDLEAKFFMNYIEGHKRKQIEDYSHYFLGSIVISNKNGKKYIIDGQQRLTSLTLLLIYLNNLQKNRPANERVEINSLIFSEKFGEKSFNISVKDREKCLYGLYNDGNFDAFGQPESVQNITARYDNIEELFPETLEGDALPYFIDWLTENVEMVEINAYSDDDAYTIFETMNDRGLSLSPTEMLKGYLLSNIDDPGEKEEANALWKKRIIELIEMDKEEESNFFKAWLRAKYADTIRERKKDATNKDFEKIGTAFHKWVREEHERIRLENSDKFRDFIMKRFDHFSRHYIRIRKASQELIPGFEYVFYNAHNNFTFQYPLLLAPLRLKDDNETVELKIRLVAGYLDIFIARRIVNSRTLSYSSIAYTMFNLMKEIRRLEVSELAKVLKDKVNEMEETFEGISKFSLHQQNSRYVHYLLARITHHIEQQSGVDSSFKTYISREIKKPFEIEHILADKFERYQDEFKDIEDFSRYRNSISDLILLPRGFNQSLGDDTYEEKVKAYFGQNLLAKSLNDQCYHKNPAFKEYIKTSGLPFQPHAEFKKKDIKARRELYKCVCEEIWSPSRFDGELVE